MYYPYDYLQARVADYYTDAEHHRLLARARPRARGRRLAAFARRHRHGDELGGTRS